MTIAEIALVVSFFTLLVNTAVALFIHGHTRDIAKVQISQQVQQQWREINQATGTDEESLSIVRGFQLEEPEQMQLDAEAQWRKDVLASMYLNQFGTIFFGIENHLFKASLTSSLEGALKRLMKDDDVFEVLQKGVFDPKFVDLCRKCRPQEGGSDGTPKR